MRVSEVDVLGTDATEDGRGQSRALVAAVCVAAVLAAAVVALLQRDTATAAPPVEVAGSMFFDDIT